MKPIRTKTLCVLTTGAMLCTLAAGTGNVLSGGTIASAATTALSSEVSATPVSTSTLTTATLSEIDPGYSNRDLAGTYDESTATKVTLNGSSISVSGSGATASGSTLTISAAGVYILSGSLTDGQIIVNATSSDKIQLVLNGVTLNCSTSAPIYVKQADKVFLTLADGTKNTVTDGKSYTFAEGEDEPNAAIFSKDDLTINGTGSLTVTGNYDRGIACKDDLVLASGTISVTSTGDGIRGNDSIAVKNANITVKAGGDGMQSNNDEDADKGWVSIDGGTLNITATNDAIQAETQLQVRGGSLDLTTGGGASANQNSTDSMKGLKGGASVLITGGTITANCSDDAIHTNGDASIQGGTLTLTTGDDGVHADASLAVTGGTIKVTKSYEGLEGETILLAGGNTSIVASDDGVNAAGGSDSNASVGGRPGQDQFASDTNAWIYIKDGTLNVSAGGDGIDSNGSLYVDGGTTTVNGPTSSGNGALDYSGTAVINGGTFVAAGASGMAQNFGTSSTQCSLMVSFSQTKSAGTPVTVKDSSGNAILTFVPTKSYQSVVISSPSLKQGSSYTIYSGGTVNGSGTNGLYTGTAATGGTEVVTTTLSSTSTSISDTGATINGGGQMGGGHGGMGGNRPDNGTIAPDNGTTPPDNGTTPPDNGTTPPDNGTADGTTDNGTTPPDNGTTNNGSTGGSAGGTTGTLSKAQRSTMKIVFNGSVKAFDVYLIGGNNYFKLRDLAYVLNGTAKQFSVGWNESQNQITLTSGQRYESVGGEMVIGADRSSSVAVTTSSLLVDGTNTPLTAYKLAGNNFYKLRDICQLFDIGVTWDASTWTVGIDTSTGYIAE